MSNFNASDYLNSNYFAAVDIPPDVRIEATVTSARPVDFKDGTSKVVIYTDYLAKGVVLNKTRLVEMIMAFSDNPANWIGQKIIIFRGQAEYGGKKVPAVVIEPIVSARICADKRPALEGSRRGSTDIRSGKGAWNDAPSPDDAPDGPKALDDDIPY